MYYLPFCFSFRSFWVSIVIYGGLRHSLCILYFQSTIHVERCHEGTSVSGSFWVAIAFGYHWANILDYLGHHHEGHIGHSLLFYFMQR